jgi:hypothetical protein
MRLFIAPFILVAMLILVPAPVLGNTNQEAAEKIASSIGKDFPSADIDVSYQGGLVRLQGEAVSQDQRDKIVEQVSKIPGINVTEIKEEIKIIAPKAPARAPAMTRQAASPVTAPVPMPNTSAPKVAAPAPMIAANVNQAPPPQQPPQTMAGAILASYPHQHYAPAYGLKPGQPSAVSAPHTPVSYAMPAQAIPQQPAPQYARQHQPAYYGPQAQAAHHPEAYGPQGPLPGQYNQPHLPNYAWPAYANYPNYSQVTYPRSYSPKAWPYIGPFYPYPQVPMGWRKVTLEHNNGWWWLDFDDGTPSGPFSGLFRQPQQYTY